MSPNQIPDHHGKIDAINSRINEPFLQKSGLNDHNLKFCLLFSVIILIALALRLPKLEQRPMHGDEAVNAVKLAELMESGSFVYDPTEYHGPTLYYFSLPLTWLRGQNTLSDLQESTLRLVPVIFGTGLIILLLLLRSTVNQSILLLTALLAAISAPLVFYSRYFIHEMVLVFSVYAFLFLMERYRRSFNKTALVFSALALSMMISTKETWIILLAAMLLAYGTVHIHLQKKNIRHTEWSLKFTRGHILVFTGIALVTVILFYSNFGSQWQNLTEAVRAWSHYWERGSSNEIHRHPWYMYLKWLFFFRSVEGTLFSEGIIALLAMVGLRVAFNPVDKESADQSFVRFLVLFSIYSLILFSLIPYKTPWNLLTFWFGWLFLAAIGVLAIPGLFKTRLQRVVAYTLLVLAALQIAGQSYRISFIRYAHADNPFVYAHPTEDVLRMADALKAIAVSLSEGYDIHVDIIAAGDDYWPLPWYLRRFNRIGWWNHVDMHAPAAPVILIQAGLEDNLIRKLYELPPPGQRRLYVPLFDTCTELRPGVEWRGYVALNVLNSGKVEPIVDSLRYGP